MTDPRRLSVNGIDILAAVAGEGPRLLFLGGTGWDLRRTPNPLVSPLVDRFTVALFDQRGMGRSGKPPGPYSMRGYAEDAAGVLDALGWERARVVGYSFGGMVAQELAIEWPERVKRLVLAASSPGGAGGASHPIHQFLDLPPLERARKGLEVADLRFTAEFQRAKPDEARRRIEARAAAQTRYAHEPGARAGLRLQLAARARHDCFDRLHRITAPTLVLAGAHDGQAPMDGQRRMAGRIPNARLDVLPGGHDFIFESDACFDAIAAFLREGA